MKKILSITTLMIMTVISMAQSLQKPEYVGQIGLINADSTVTILKKEKATMGGKASALSYVPVPGASLFGKSKAVASLDGKTSETVIEHNSFSLVLRGETNSTDPNDFIGVVRLEVKKKKRELEIGSMSALGGVKTNVRQNTVAWEAHKYGDDCYLITFSDLEPGEYGITLGGDIMNISTFSVR